MAPVGNTHLDRVILTGGGKNVLTVWVPVQAVDLGEVSSQILHRCTGLLQHSDTGLLILECLPQNSVLGAKGTLTLSAQLQPLPFVSSLCSKPTTEDLLRLPHVLCVSLSASFLPAPA